MRRSQPQVAINKQLIVQIGKPMGSNDRIRFGRSDYLSLVPDCEREKVNY